MFLPMRMYCSPFIWPFIHSPGIYDPISALVKASQRDGGQTVMPLLKSGSRRRRKNTRKVQFFNSIFFRPLLKKNVFFCLFLFFAMCFSQQTNANCSNNRRAGELLLTALALRCWQDWQSMAWLPLHN